MKQALTNYLLDAEDLEALIADRITWGVRPQGSALPSIAMHQISGSPEYDDDGEAGLSSARIQIDCWGDTYIAADNVARQVMVRLSGNGAAFVQDDIEFQAAFNEDHQDDFERGAGDEDLYRVRLDFMIWHKEI